MRYTLDQIERINNAGDRYGHITPGVVAELCAEVRRLRNLLTCRPALNSGLIEAYSQWTAVVYDSEAARARESARDCSKCGVKNLPVGTYCKGIDCPLNPARAKDQQ